MTTNHAFNGGREAQELLKALQAACAPAGTTATATRERGTRRWRESTTATRTATAPGG